jgi:hypothetical protein
VLPEIEAASELAREGRDSSAYESGGRDVWSHHFDRLYGAKCWFRTQRNIAAWIEGVHGYIEAEDASEKKRCRALVRHTVLDEKENARDLLQHVESAQTEWMIESELGETTFIYGDNIAELLRKKIALMEGREDDEPFVDPDFMWRVPGINC